MGQKRRKESRGTDDPFYKLMKLSGEAVLKLIGIDPPGDYEPRACVLKEKKLYLDIVAVPKKNTDRDRVFIEFQGYREPMIRYLLGARILMSCAQDKYTGPLCGAIVYTDKIYQEAALPLETGSLSSSFRLEGRFEEIVLTDYTCEQLINTDPRLIVLAPFTLEKNTGKDRLAGICREWKEKVCQAYDSEDRAAVTEILGLFILNRFRNLSLEEVILMLNFDLAKTKAGKELIGIGLEKGSREMLLFAYEEKWGKVPQYIDDAVRKISARSTIRDLFGTLLRSRSQDEFESALKSTGFIGNA